MNANRRFLSESLKIGLELGTVSPDDVIRHVTPEVLAHHLPVSLKTKLLEASLAAERMTPNLIVETLGSENLAEHAPLHVVWACIAECARRSLGNVDDVRPAASAAPAAATSSSPSGPVAAGPTAADDLKPNKSVRPSAVRMPGRISSLSPRSRPPIAPPRGTGPAAVDEPAAFDQMATRAKSEGDFDILDEESSPVAQPGLRTDEETRPGELGRKL